MAVFIFEKCSALLCRLATTGVAHFENVQTGRFLNGAELCGGRAILFSPYIL